MVTNALFNKPIYIHSKVPPYRFVSKSEYREFMSFQACNNCRYKQILEWKLKRFIECILRNRHSSRVRCENKSISKLQCFSLANMPLYCHVSPGTRYLDVLLEYEDLFCFDFVGWRRMQQKSRHRLQISRDLFMDSVAWEVSYSLF